MKVFNRTLISGLVGASLLAPAISSTAETKKHEGFALPSADSGECYGRVALPAEYKTETVRVVTRQASNAIEVSDPIFQDAEEKVMIKEAHSKLVPVPAVYDTVDVKELISPARQVWVRDSLKGDMPVSNGLLADLEAGGVKLDEVKPGQCFYEYHKPAVYGEKEDKVLVEQATELLDVEPASFAKSEKQVMLEPASKRLVVVPAVFKKASEKVLVEPAHSEWQVGRGPIEKIDNLTGEIMCRVDIPARYETVETQVVSAPARTTTLMQPAKFDTVKIETLVADAQELRTPVPAKFETFKRPVMEKEAQLYWSPKKLKGKDVGEETGNVICRKEIEAEYKTFKRKVVKKPGTFAKTAVPAEFKTVEVKRLVTEAEAKTENVAEVVETFERRVKVADARMEWRPVLCETNVTQDVIKQIQTVLNGRGYQAGTVDGLLGRGTMNALQKFQEDNKLAKGGLTYATIEALGIDL